MTLTKFLLARIAEDEAVAVAAANDGPWRIDFGQGAEKTCDLFCRFPAGRLWADALAKRQVVELHPEIDPKRILYPLADPMCQTCHRDGDEPDWPCATLRVLAAPYADHADYDDAWRPV